MVSPGNLKATHALGAAVDWQARVRREALLQEQGDHELLSHLTLRPAMPPEYAVEGLVAVTFRWRGRRFVTSIDAAAAVRLGARMGLDAGEAVAMVDSHERVHVALQLEGATEEEEERQALFVDAVMLSLRHEVIAEHLVHGDFGLVSKVGPGFWEALIDLGRKPPAP